MRRFASHYLFILPWEWCHDDTETSAFNVNIRLLIIIIIITIIIIIIIIIIIHISHHWLYQWSRIPRSSSYFL